MRSASTSPSPVVYQLAEARLGIRREKIGFVSSNAWDVAGAAAFGFQTYWLDRQNAPCRSARLRAGQDHSFGDGTRIGSSLRDGSHLFHRPSAPTAANAHPTMKANPPDWDRAYEDSLPGR